MKSLWLTTLTLALTCLVISLVGPVATAQAEEEAPGAAAFAKHKCNMCHGVAAAGIEAKTKSDKMKGDDLSGFTTEADFATLAAYARKEGELDGKTHKKPFKGTDEELQAIVDWLGSLEAQE